MTDFRHLTSARLKALVTETEETLADLRDELERRDDIRQEHEIAHLHTHMKSAELSLKTIRDFLAYLRDDLRHKRQR